MPVTTKSTSAAAGALLVGLAAGNAAPPVFDAGEPTPISELDGCYAAIHRSNLSLPEGRKVIPPAGIAATEAGLIQCRDWQTRAAEALQRWQEEKSRG